MALPVLYSFRRCPYAMRARIALQYARVTVELREVVLRSKPAELLAISPKGTVPVLLLADGRVLEESLDIMQWALAQHDPDGWAHDPAGIGAALVARNDGPFKQLLDRYKYAERYPEQRREHYRERAVALHLAPLEERLRQSRWLLGAAPALADAAIFPFVRQFAEVDRAWFDAAPYPALRAWLARQLGAPRFNAVMQKYPPWAPGEAAVLF